jgi:hypothetical protein
MSRSSSKVTVTTSGDKQLDQLLAALPQLIVATGGPIDKAVSKAGTVVAKRARAIAPDSKKTKTKEKQSAKSKGIWTQQVRTLIRTVTRKYDTAAVAIVGPKNPEGNAAHFMQEKPRRLVLWGKTTRVALYRISRNWITQAFDETKEEQQAAMVSSLRDDLDRVMRGN